MYFRITEANLPRHTSLPTLLNGFFGGASLVYSVAITFLCYTNENKHVSYFASPPSFINDVWQHIVLTVLILNLEGLPRKRQAFFIYRLFKTGF